jgi:hypothetical protein
MDRRPLTGDQVDVVLVAWNRLAVVHRDIPDADTVSQRRDRQLARRGLDRERTVPEHKVHAARIAQ